MNYSIFPLKFDFHDSLDIHNLTINFTPMTSKTTFLGFLDLERIYSLLMDSACPPVLYCYLRIEEDSNSATKFLRCF